jgi:hypothetical protein
MPNPTTTTTRETPPSTIMVHIIKKKHHGWTIEAADIDDNARRFLDVMDDFSRRRKERDQRKKPDHLPIIFNEGDTVTFTCTSAFQINAKKDEVVKPIDDAPNDPFGWNGPKTVEAETGGEVSGVVTRGSGVKEQAFYKFFGWVMENGLKVPVDPCGYCGS